jgi:hypothetical protein
MANELSSLQKIHYSKKVMSELFFKVTALSLAEMVDMPHGITYTRPKIDFNGLTSYVKNTDITVSDTDTDAESLTINQTPLVPFGIDEVELLEIDYALLDTLATRAAQQIREDIDGNFFNEVLNSDLTNASPITLTAGVSQNSVATYSNAVAALVNNGVDKTKLVSVIDPMSLSTIGNAAIGNTFNEADVSFRRGFTGQRFAGTMVNESTLLTTTTDLQLATNPSADDTVTINGVVFTFKAVPALPGEVDIAGSAAGSVANLVNAINGTGTPSATTYIEVAANDRNRKLASITATDNTTSIGIVSKRGYRPMVTDMTNGSNNFDAIVINNVIMEKGAIALSIQKGINMVTRDKPLQIGTNFFTWARYGLKTFKEGKERMYRLQIVAAAAE